MPPLRSGQTSTSGTIAHIEINGNMFKNCTDLFAAQCIIHEFYHGFIASQTYIGSQGTNDTAILNYFPTCFNAYNVVLDNTIGFNLQLYGGSGDPHPYIAAYMTTITARALAEFDNHRLDYEYYWLLSWGGLQQTPLWQHYQAHPAANNNQKDGFEFALTQERMDAILHALNAEKDNTNDAKSPKHNFNNCY
jgi:hypothetical protein